MQKRYNRHVFGPIILFLILFFQSYDLSAQDEIPDSVIMERIHLIEQMLARSKPGVERWWIGWLGAYGVATIGQGAVALTSNNESLREDMYLGAATTLLGVAGQLLTPLLPPYKTDRLAKITEDTHEARLQKLKNAEELLKECARREKSGRSWQMHAVTGAVNLCGGLIVWHGFKRNVWAGVQNFALNTIITEAQIWTQPTRAVKDYRNYCKMYIDGEKPGAPKPNAKWLISAGPGMVSLKVVF
jgi:hypothetical protein